MYWEGDDKRDARLHKHLFDVNNAGVKRKSSL